MDMWSSTPITAVKLPSGAWVRVDQVAAVVEKIGAIRCVLASGDHVLADERGGQDRLDAVVNRLWKGDHASNR